MMFVTSFSLSPVISEFAGTVILRSDHGETSIFPDRLPFSYAPPINKTGQLHEALCRALEKALKKKASVIMRKL
jgi:hypothetical protein